MIVVPKSPRCWILPNWVTYILRRTYCSKHFPHLRTQCAHHAYATSATKCFMEPFRSVRKSFAIVPSPYAHLVRLLPGAGHTMVPKHPASQASGAAPLPPSIRCKQSLYHLPQMRTIVSLAIPSVSHLPSAKLLVVAAGYLHRNLFDGIIVHLEASPYMS